MENILELPKIKLPKTEITTIVINTNGHGISSIRIDDSQELGINGKIKELFDRFIETDKQIKNIDTTIVEMEKEKEKLQIMMDIQIGKLKRIAVGN